MRAHRTSTAAGFTMVELLVAMTVGLLLTVAVAQLFIGSRRTYATTDDLSRMQENMRYAHDLLTRNVRLIGYMSSPNRYSVDTDGFTGVYTGGNLPLQATNGAGTASDTFTAKFQGSNDAFGAPDGAVIDCLGNAVGAATIVTNIFSIGLDAVSNSPGLFCQSSLNATATPVLVVPNVDNMQVLYGEDTTGDSNADRYVPASLLADANQVVSMRIALLFRSANANVRPTVDTTAYTLNGVTLPAFNTTHIRRVMTVTISLRNRVP